MRFINFLFRLLRIQKNKGFKGQKETIEDDHYVVGDGQIEAKFGEAVKVLRPDGQWDDYLPPFEAQVLNGVETMFCTAFHTENPIQILMKFKYNYVEEYSEIYNANLAGVSPYKGGSPHEVAESWRKSGALKIEKLPLTAVKSKQDLIINANDYKEEGKKLLEKFEIGHDWIWSLTPNGMKEALKYSPVGVGVSAWSYDNKRQVYYKPAWANDNHWTTLYGYVEGKYWKVYDSYHNEYKHLDWNYPFKFAKRYTVVAKDQGMVSEGRDLYNRLKNKHILIAGPKENNPFYSQMYYVGEQLKYEFWTTNAEYLQKLLDKGLRDEEKKGNFIGISLDDFDKLKTYAVLSGINIIGKEDAIKALEGKLHKLGV